MAKGDKKDVARAKAETNKFVKEMAKRGVNVGGSGSVSARQPSVAVKTGVKNKLKTQGKATTLSGKGYSRTGKK